MVLFLACSEPSSPKSSAIIEEAGGTIELTQAELVPSVIQVQASGWNNGILWVELKWTKDGEEHTLLSERYTLEDSLSFSLMGHPPDHIVEITPFLELDDGSTETLSTQTFQAGSLLPALDAVALDHISYTQSSGYLLGTLFDETPFLIIMNHQGEILWGVQQYDDEHGGMDSKLSVDGQSILFNRFSKDKDIDGGHIERITIDGVSVESIRTPMAHHPFTELPDGTLTYIALDPKDTEEFGSVCGDAVVEISPDGTHRTIFSTWNNIPLYESITFNSTFYPQGHDWTHGNWIKYNEERDSYLFSMVGVNVILEIDRNGSVLNTFGGKDSPISDYGVEPPNDTFHYSHAPQWNSLGELMMISTTADRTRAIAFRLEEDLLVRSWMYGQDLGYDVRHLGEVSEINSDLRLVNWGSSGHLQLINRQNELLWEMYTPLGLWFAQFDHLDRLPGMQAP